MGQHRRMLQGGTRPSVKSFCRDIQDHSIALLTLRSTPNIAVRMRARCKEIAVPKRMGHINPAMRVHLINPSDTSFGTAVITPRWLYVLAAATPASFGDPVLCDETLLHWNASSVESGDLVG